MPRRAFWQSPLVMRGTSILWHCDGADGLPAVTIAVVVRVVAATAAAKSVRAQVGKRGARNEQKDKTH